MSDGEGVDLIEGLVGIMRPQAEAKSMTVRTVIAQRLPVIETDPGKRREFAARALAMVRERHARYFTGPTAAYAELESLFLTMEGVGQWAAYRLARMNAGGNDAEALRLVRDNKRYWSQDQGLALFLLVDALVPNWQARVFAPAPASPFALLEEAVAGR